MGKTDAGKGQTRSHVLMWDFTLEQAQMQNEVLVSHRRNSIGAVSE